jgi:hypothetical protein
MPQEFSDLSHRGSVSQHIGGKGMTQQMRPFAWSVEATFL